jgi:dihydrofolate synthase/folylpolyglutamate synthase
MNLEAWLELLEERHPKAIDLGLERCGAVYRTLGSPRPAEQVFTVAGTNGKGSTVAYLASLCDAMGLRYGCYTSPHIFQFNERISVMGEPVSDDHLVEAFERVEAARDQISLTYFEFTTLAGLLILSQSKLDIAVLEVGLGGRLDTVNLVDTDCAVITPIGLDHQEFLGADLQSIAMEKAGIIRPGIPVVCTEINPPSPVLQVSGELNAKVYRRGIDFDLARDPAAGGGRLQFSSGFGTMRVQSPSMAGAHQLDNLATALAAFELLSPGGFANAGKIPAAVSNTRVPGRLQRVHAKPEILLDVGHNELAAQVVADFLQLDKRPAVICVLAMLADKPAEKVANVFENVCRNWLCADSPGARGQSGEALASRIKSTLTDAQIDSFESLEEAMQAAVSGASEDETILVFGSFTTVSAAAGWVRNSLQHDVDDAARINRD